MKTNKHNRYGYSSIIIPHIEENYNFSKHEETILLFNHIEQKAKEKNIIKEEWVSFNNKIFDNKILERIKDLKDSFFEENKELPNKNSEKLLFNFLSEINSQLLPSITLSPQGFFSIRWILKNEKIVLCFNDDEFIEYLVIINKEKDEFIEGRLKINSFINLFKNLIDRILK